MDRKGEDIGQLLWVPLGGQRHCAAVRLVSEVQWTDAPALRVSTETVQEGIYRYAPAR